MSTNHPGKLQSAPQSEAAKRLRAWATWSSADSQHKNPYEGRLPEGARCDLSADVLTLLAEREKLRSALQVTAPAWHYSVHPSQGTFEKCIWEQCVAARAALKEE